MHSPSSQSSVHHNHVSMQSAVSEVQGRNLVVCIDGTANKFGSSNTNVVELYRRLIKDGSRQVTYYNSGIGTLATPSYISFAFAWRMVDYSIDFAIGWNFEKAILKAYRWLTENYRPDDRIYLLGFSRGAYQVRTLAAMIDEVGLLQRGNEEQIPFAYDLYARNSVNRKVSVIFISGFLLIVFVSVIMLLMGTFQLSLNIPLLLGWIILGQPLLNILLNRSYYEPKHEIDASAPMDNLANRFKDIFSRRARVHFLGVWDTVSSLGHLRSKDLPKTVDGGDHICVFRHALALDEYRVKFLPEYCCGGASWISTSGGDPASSSPISAIPRVKETWFRGSHPDIGGKHNIGAGSAPNNPSLRWMVYEAAKSGLLVDLAELHDRPAEPEIVRITLKGFWRMMEYLPIDHRSYENRDSTTLAPHHGKHRIPVPGQRVHVSVRCPPNGIDDVDDEGDEIPEMVRQPCANCDH